MVALARSGKRGIQNGGTRSGCRLEESKRRPDLGKEHPGSESSRRQAPLHRSGEELGIFARNADADARKLGRSVASATRGGQQYACQKTAAASLSNSGRGRGARVWR